MKCSHSRQWNPAFGFPLPAYVATITYPALCSKSFPETNLKPEAVIGRSQLSGGGLFILCGERQTIGDAILKCDYLIWIRSHVCRIGHSSFLADSLSHS